MLPDYAIFDTLCVICFLAEWDDVFAARVLDLPYWTFQNASRLSAFFLCIFASVREDEHFIVFFHAAKLATNLVESCIYIFLQPVIFSFL